MMLLEQWAIAAMLGLGLVVTAGAPAQSPSAETQDAPPAAAAQPPKPAADPAQQQLEKDTADLLQLVQELKVEIDKAGSDTLSLAALRKADAIQKLAKNLKEKMKERGQVAASKQ
jgi:hypothetical protein